MDIFGWEIRAGFKQQVVIRLFTSCSTSGIKYGWYGDAASYHYDMVAASSWFA